MIKIRGHDYKTIYIRYQGNTTELKVCLCYRVENLKQRIQQKLGFKPECQELSFNGKRLDKNGVDIYSLGVREGSIIDLDIIQDFEDFIENDGDYSDYKEKYKNELNQLKDMGFLDEDINIEVLKQCSGNVEYTVQKLIEIMK